MYILLKGNCKRLMYIFEYQLNNIPFFMHNRNIKNHDKFTLINGLQRQRGIYVEINLFIYFFFNFL
jgi:hypothetical protein